MNNVCANSCPTDTFDHDELIEMVDWGPDSDLLGSVAIIDRHQQTSSELLSQRTDIKTVQPPQLQTVIVTDMTTGTSVTFFYNLLSQNGHQAVYQECLDEFASPNKICGDSDNCAWGTENFIDDKGEIGLLNDQDSGKVSSDLTDNCSEDSGINCSDEMANSFCDEDSKTTETTHEPSNKRTGDFGSSSEEPMAKKRKSNGPADKATKNDRSKWSRVKRQAALAMAMEDVVEAEQRYLNKVYMRAKCARDRYAAQKMTSEMYELLASLLKYEKGNRNKMKKSLFEMDSKQVRFVLFEQTQKKKLESRAGNERGKNKKPSLSAEEKESLQVKCGETLFVAFYERLRMNLEYANAGLSIERSFREECELECPKQQKHETDKNERPFLTKDMLQSVKAFTKTMSTRERRGESNKAKTRAQNDRARVKKAIETKAKESLLEKMLAFVNNQSASAGFNAMHALGLHIADSLDEVPALSVSLVDNSPQKKWRQKNDEVMHLPFTYVQTPTIGIEKAQLEHLLFFGEGSQGYLDDRVIMAYLNIVANFAKNVVVVDPLLLAAQVEKPECSDFLLKHVHGDLAGIYIVLMPVHLSNHWTLVAYRTSTKSLAYYDSFNGQLPKKYATAVKAFVTGITQRTAPGSSLRLDVQHVLVPQQTNSNDCGVFVCAYAEVLARQLDMGEQITAILKKSNFGNMSVFREKICHHILHVGVAHYSGDDMPFEIPGEVEIIGY